MATKISFFKLSKAAYDALGTVAAGAIYFVTDKTSGKIYVDQKCYGEMNVTANAVTNISYVNDEDHVNHLKVEFTTGDPVYVALPEGAIYTAGNGIKIEDKVISALDETLDEDLTVMGVTVGNLTDSKTIPAGTSLKDVLKQMLTKELDYVKGSAPSVALRGVSSGVKLVGTELTGDLSYSFTDGKFKKWDNTTVNAGCVAGEPVYNGSLPHTVALGANTFSVSIPYGASTAQTTLTTNIGSASKVEAFPAGTASSSTVTVTGSLPVYATITSTDEMTAMTLKAWSTGSMESDEMNMKPSTPESPRKFSVPRKATSLQMFNTVANKYEAVSLSDYTETTESRTFGTHTQTYYTYAYNGAASGEVKLKVKF